MGTGPNRSSNMMDKNGMTGLEILDAPDVEEEEVSFDTLYGFLLRESDIIITIDAEQEEAVRRGLAVVKHNHNKKMASAGEKQDSKLMKFKVLEQLPNEQIKLQIWLQKREGVQIHRLIVSDKSL